VVPTARATGLLLLRCPLRSNSRRVAAVWSAVRVMTDSSPRAARELRASPRKPKVCRAWGTQGTGTTQHVISSSGKDEE
jgi:hypothetical protein